MRGLAEDRLGGSFLDDPAGVHDRDPVGDLDQHGEVVRDEEHREPELPLQALQELQHLRLHHHVQRRRGLVRDHEGRVAGERHRDHHSLLLPSGQLVGVVIDAPRGEPDLLQQLGRPDPRLALPGQLVDGDRFHDLVADATDGIEGVQRPLEDDRRARPADRPKFAGRERQDVVPVEGDAPLDLRRGRVQPEDRSRDRRLPAARLAREPEDVSAIDLDVDTAYGGDVAALRAVRHPEIAGREHAHRLSAPGSSG